MENKQLSIALYMKYYIGCIIEIYNLNAESYKRILTPERFSVNPSDWTNIKPILRSLKSMTDEEKIEFCNIGRCDEKWSDKDKIWWLNLSLINSKHIIISPEEFHWLVKKGFWLFGNEYFEKGLIIQKGKDEL
jgi:hypothetical protein